MTDTDKTENFRILAQNALDAGDGEEALSYFNKILENDPMDDGAWLGKCKSMANMATLADMKEKSALSAAKNAVKFAPEGTMDMVKAEAAQALASYCAMCLGASDSHRANFSPNALQAKTAKGFGRSLVKGVERREEHRERVKRLIPMAEYALELAPEDSFVIEIIAKVREETASGSERLKKRIAKVREETASGSERLKKRIKGKAEELERLRDPEVLKEKVERMKLQQKQRKRKSEEIFCGQNWEEVLEENHAGDIQYTILRSTSPVGYFLTIACIPFLIVGLFFKNSMMAAGLYKDLGHYRSEGILALFKKAGFRFLLFLANYNKAILMIGSHINSG